MRIRTTNATTIAALLTLAIAGCAPPESVQNSGASEPAPIAPQNAPANGPTTASDTPKADHGADAGPMGNQTATPNAAPPMTNAAPMMGGMSGDPMAPLTKTPELDKKVKDAVKSGNKRAISLAYTVRGNFRQNDANAGSRMKYRAALSDFRKALKADPKNADATKYMKNIEGIYQSLGRPVPTEDVP